MTTEQSIKYVEVILVNTAKENITSVRGILTGYPSKSMYAAQFINLQGQGGVIKTCSESHHTIRTIKIAYVDNSVERGFFKGDQEAQLKAKQTLEDIMLELRADGMASACGIIDVSKYKDIPKEYLKTETTPIYGGTRSDQADNTNRNHIHVYHAAPIKEMTFLKRKTRKPSSEKLEQLKQKTMMVTANTYVGKELPKLDEEDVESALQAAIRMEEEAALREYSGMYFC